MTQLLSSNFSLTPHLHRHPHSSLNFSRFKFNHNIHHPHRASISCSAHRALFPLEAYSFGLKSRDLGFEKSGQCSLSFLAPLGAILFDIDGTISDSDPLHFYAFRDMLQAVGFNGGVPITEEFFIKTISGQHNVNLATILFPD